MRGVFDSVILVRGLINPFSRCGRLVFDHHGDYDLIVSPDMVDECLDVLNRPEIVARFRPEGDRDFPTMLSIIAQATVVEPSHIPEVCRDPEDDKVLAAAATGIVDFIVSEDLDLLALREYAGIPILTAGEVLRMLAQPGDPRE